MLFSQDVHIVEQQQRIGKPYQTSRLGHGLPSCLTQCNLQRNEGEVNRRNFNVMPDLVK